MSTTESDEVSGTRKQQCIRYNETGVRAVETREPEAVRLWVQFNKDFRPASALFVDGVCVHPGQYSQEKCNAIESELAQAGNTGTASQMELVPA